MNSVTVSGYSKIYYLYYALVGISGVLIVGDLAFDYFKGDLDKHWYLLGIPKIIIGMYGLKGFGYAFGLLDPRFPEITIDDDGIRSNTEMDHSPKWKYLSRVELYKNRIEVEYATSYLSNQIKIPWSVRVRSANLKKLNDGLSGYCEKYDVEFSSKAKI